MFNIQVPKEEYVPSVNGFSSHIFVLGYGWFFVDALMVMMLAVIYLLLTRRHSDWGELESVGATAALQTRKR